jgi:hypothetical protein
MHSPTTQPTHREARTDRGRDALCTGWDWPTLRLVKPLIYAQLINLDARIRDASLALAAYNPQTIAA